MILSWTMLVKLITFDFPGSVNMYIRRRFMTPVALRSARVFYMGTENAILTSIIGAMVVSLTVYIRMLTLSKSIPAMITQTVVGAGNTTMNRATANRQ
jgi:hypothetical protein